MKTYKEYISEGLDSVRKFAEKKGVSLNIDKMDKKSYHLSWMDRNKGKPGSGREVLQKLHSHADKHNKEIHLIAHESHPKLVKYYSSMGYESQGETDDGTYMIRKPKK